jgi:hypothetical protein
VSAGPVVQASGPAPAGETAAPGDSTLTFRNAPLAEVLDAITARTGVRFLYRDALAAGVRVSLQADGRSVLDALQEVLPRHGLRLRVDAARRQAILTRASEPARQALRGHALDARTGERLPFATVTWPGADGRRQGTSADETGAFQVPLRPKPEGRLVLRVSYVGYAADTVYVDPRDPPASLAVRLRPRRTPVPEVVVQSSALQSDLDTTWHALIRPERHAPLGEENVLQALEGLPAVRLSPALSGGIGVRGSPADAFRVRLDGIPIYNQTHLFGLFDAFNAEALQTVGFHYGVAPADLPAPPGGTLELRTRAGSRTEVRATTGASPTAVSATAEGPIAGGAGSWLVSARHSTLGLDAFGNERLVAQGLGLERRTEPVPGTGQTVEDLLFTPGDASARFFDVHARGSWETDAGGRWALSAYAGGDDADQAGALAFFDRTPTLRERLRRDRLDTTAVSTDRRWGTVGASLQWSRPVGARIHSDLQLAASRYESRYATDRFVYAVPREGRAPRLFTGPFENDNALVDLSLSHRLTGAARGPGTWTLGYAATYYDVGYAEEAAAASRFRGDQQSVQLGGFGQAERTLGPARVQAGLRVQYFGEAEALRFSPRLQGTLWPGARASLGAGYSRNHQFLHRLHVVGDVSPPVWVPSTTTQPPGTVDHLMARLSLRPSPATALQLEGYWKQHDDLRQHGTVAALRPDAEAVLFSPWTVGNASTARGLEALGRQALGPFTGTAAYTLSRVTIDPAGGAPREAADWDRRHQLTARLAWAPSPHASLHATWAVASGPPNPYAGVRPAEPERLPPYHRLDLGAAATLSAGGADWSLRATLFNAYGRDNPWHRTAVLAVGAGGSDPGRRRDTGAAFVDVYDLGLRPSLSVSAAW